MFRDMSGVRSDSTKPPVDVPRRTPRILEDEARRAEEEKVPVAEGDKELQHRQTRVDTWDRDQPHKKVGLDVVWGESESLVLQTEHGGGGGLGGEPGQAGQSILQLQLQVGRGLANISVIGCGQLWARQLFD